VTAGVLLAIAAALLLGGGQLRRLRALDRHPGLALLAWNVLAFGALSSVALAGLALLVPVSALGTDLASLLRACVYTLQAAYAAPTQLPREALGATLVLAATLWPAARVARELVVAASTRRRTSDALALVCRRRDDLDAVVVETDVAAAYCVPGRDRRIVLTTAAIAALDDDELQAVLAHERAHLRQQHHRLVAVAHALARAVPAPLFHVASAEVERLVELAADDAAADAVDEVAVAGALVTLGGMTAPRAALAAAGTASAARIVRLLDPAAPVRVAYRAAFVAGLLALATAPAVLVAYPAVAAANAEVCQLPPLPVP
jgi:Zn-dependent protease with chaperone function